MDESHLTSRGYKIIADNNTIAGFRVVSKDGTKYYVEYVDTSARNFKFTKDRYEILRRVNHKNVVKVLGLLEFPGSCYILYEYFDGKLLSSLLDQQYSEKQLAEISSQIMQGLRELHSNGIVHTVLNVDSIVRTDRNEYKIFKLSYSSPTGQEMMSTIQSQIVIYPPEFDPANTRTVSEKFDVWSLGLLIHKLHRKTDAFPTSRALTQYIKSMKLLATEGSDNLNNLLQNCLNPDPEQRSTVNELLDHAFITFNTNSSRTDTKGFAPPVSSGKTDINHPSYIPSLIASYQEKQEKLRQEIESYKAQQAGPLKQLDDQIAKIISEIDSIKRDIQKIKQYKIPNEADRMTDSEVQYFNGLAKIEVFKGNSAQNGYIQPDKRITLNVESRNPTKYNWDILAKCFQKLRAAAIDNRKGFILAIPKDYIFDLDEFEEIALPLIKDTLHTGVNQPIITIEFYSVLSDEQVDYVTEILGRCNFFIKFKKDRISFFSQLNVASYKQSNPDSCLCTFEVF